MGTSPLGDRVSRKSAPISAFYRETSWIEAPAIDQLNQVASWPGMLHVAAFPDLHPGRHGPVGAAFLADRLYPQLVGPDIGCGMSLFRLSLERRKLKLDKAVRRLAVLDHPMDPEEGAMSLEEMSLGELDSHGLGTIGGGNHFCEVQEVVEVAYGAPLAKGELCLLVHSGSRSHGAGIFNRLEARWNEGFAATSPEGRAYLGLHDAAAKWASLNRRLIAERAAAQLRSSIEMICDAPHNVVSEVQGAWLHRKGAASAGGGLTPLAGSRDDYSFLLSSHAEQEALWSLSHGAGRRYDRASMHGRIPRTRSSLAAMTRTRFGGQVVCANRDLLIEEAGAAYKDARSVVADLEGSGIASRLATLAPLLTWKTGAQA